MKMRTILAVIALGAMLASCSSFGVYCCTDFDTIISIKYLNEDGDNLFVVEGGYSESSINIYHKINGEWVLNYNEKLDYPKDIRIDEREDGTYLSIFPSKTIVSDNCTETKIEFSDSDADIIKTEIQKTNSNVSVVKVWYNGELKWELSQTERIFEVVK
jgi:hypothetical protein